MRGARVKRPKLEDFAYQQQAFTQALTALQEGRDLVALTWNGRGVIGALNDNTAKRLSNDAVMNGARAAVGHLLTKVSPSGYKQMRTS